MLRHSGFGVRAVSGALEKQRRLNRHRCTAAQSAAAVTAAAVVTAQEDVERRSQLLRKEEEKKRRIEEDLRACKVCPSPQVVAITWPAPAQLFQLARVRAGESSGGWSGRSVCSRRPRLCRRLTCSQAARRGEGRASSVAARFVA